MYKFPPGGRLVLNQPHAGPWYFQGGRAVSEGEIDEYETYCQLHFSPDEVVVRLLQPQSFTVTAANREESVEDREPPVWMRIVRKFEDVEDQPERYEAVHLFLRGEQQPFVERLSCARKGDMAFADLITRREVERALGGLFTLEEVQ